MTEQRTKIPGPAGLIVLQGYDRNATNDGAREVIYASGEWEHRRGIRHSFVGSVGGNRSIAVPVSQEEEEIEILYHEAPVRFEADRVQGVATVLPADSTRRTVWLGSYPVRGGLMPDDTVRELVEALDVLPGASSGLYEIVFAGLVDAPVVRRLDPLPALVSADAVWSQALAPASYVVANATAAQGGAVAVVVSAPRDRFASVDHREMRTKLFRVLCLSDVALGNALRWVAADGCVAVEPARQFAKGSLARPRQRFQVLAGRARSGQIDFARSGSLATDELASVNIEATNDNINKWVATGATPAEGKEWALVNIGQSDVGDEDPALSWLWLRLPDLAALEDATAGAASAFNESVKWSHSQEDGLPQERLHYFGMSSTGEIMYSSGVIVTGANPLKVRTFRDESLVASTVIGSRDMTMPLLSRFYETGIELPLGDAPILVNTGKQSSSGRRAAAWYWLDPRQLRALPRRVLGDTAGVSDSVWLPCIDFPAGAMYRTTTRRYRVGLTADDKLLLANFQSDLHALPFTVRGLSGGPTFHGLARLNIPSAGAGWKDTGIVFPLDPAPEWLYVNWGSRSPTMGVEASGIWEWCRYADLAGRANGVAGEAVPELGESLVSYTDPVLYYGLQLGHSTNRILTALTLHTKLTLNVPAGPYPTPLTIRSVTGRDGRSLAGPDSVV